MNDPDMPSEPVKAMCCLLCAKLGDQTERPCRDCGGDEGSPCWSWFDFEDEARAVLALAFNLIAHTGKVDPFALADAGVEIFGDPIPEPAPSVAEPRS